MIIENGSRQVSARIEVGLKEKAHAAGISKRGKKEKEKRNTTTKSREKKGGSTVKVSGNKRRNWHEPPEKEAQELRIERWDRNDRGILLDCNNGERERNRRWESAQGEVRLGEVSLAMHEAGRSPRSRRKGAVLTSRPLYGIADTLISDIFRLVACCLRNCVTVRTLGTRKTIFLFGKIDRRNRDYIFMGIILSFFFFQYLDKSRTWNICEKLYDEKLP